jgi:hypothetical protein
MTTLLQKAFTEAAKLADEEQDALAALILDEIASDQRWDDLFARSQNTLRSMAQEARAEYQRGETHSHGSGSGHMTNMINSSHNPVIIQP